MYLKIVVNNLKHLHKTQLHTCDIIDNDCKYCYICSVILLSYLLYLTVYIIIPIGEVINEGLEMYCKLNGVIILSN